MYKEHAEAKVYQQRKAIIERSHQRAGGQRWVNIQAVENNRHKGPHH